MKLSNLYNLSAACFEQVHSLFYSARVRPRPSGDGGRKGQERARCKSNSSLPCEAAHKTCYRSIAASARVRSTLQKSAEQRLQKVPSDAAALINQNAVCVEFACVSFPNIDKSILLNRFVDVMCFNCLFSFYFDDKDKQCLSVISDFYEKN